MDEYIRRGDALKAVCHGCTAEFDEMPCEPSECQIKERLNEIPAADVVPVVRCRNCKDWEGRVGVKDIVLEFGFCTGRYYGSTPPDFFCADGEAYK